MIQLHKYMFSYLRKIVPKRVVNIFSSDMHKPLGRWTLNHENIKNTHKKIDWSNEDHCGPCGHEALDMYIKKNEEKLKELQNKVK